MTHLTLTLSNYLQNPIEALLSAIRTFRQSRVEGSLARETIKELHKLSDKELNDIGISRGDIYSVAHGDKSMVRGVL